MPEKIDLKKALDSFSAPRGGFRLIEVPDQQYLMVDGHGDPNTSPAYTDALAALYPVAYRLKFISKRERDRDYVVPPLEGLWWAEDMDVFVLARKDEYQWTAMILQPDFVTKAQVKDAVAELRRKGKDLPALGLLRLETLKEGRAAQVMHIGPFDADGPTIERVHAFVAVQARARAAAECRLAVCGIGHFHKLIAAGAQHSARFFQQSQGARRIARASARLACHRYGYR